MRRTQKYSAAIYTVNKMRLKLKSFENADVYMALNAKKYFWNHRNGRWEKKAHAPSSSIFINDDGSPTGIVKIRLMCHPAQTADTVRALVKAHRLKIIEVSEPYENRKGIGERSYVTALLLGDEQ